MKAKDKPEYLGNSVYVQFNTKRNYITIIMRGFSIELDMQMLQKLFIYTQKALKIKFK